MTTPHPPASQSPRVACDEGRDRVDLDRAVRDGTYRMVVMNADGSGGVQTSTTLAVTCRTSPPWQRPPPAPGSRC